MARYVDGFILPVPKKNAKAGLVDPQLAPAAASNVRESCGRCVSHVRLLQNAPIVGGLLGSNPFPNAPPRYVRALLYDYRFASPEAHRKGAWWRRELLGTYYPAIQLSKGDETE